MHRGLNIVKKGNNAKKKEKIKKNEVHILKA